MSTTKQLTKQQREYLLYIGVQLEHLYDGSGQSKTVCDPVLRVIVDNTSHSSLSDNPDNHHTNLINTKSFSVLETIGYIRTICFRGWYTDDDIKRLSELRYLYKKLKSIEYFYKK